MRRRVRFVPFLSDAELLALYRSARAVLYPTQYEGFGFPAIEAQAAGVPAMRRSLVMGTAARAALAKAARAWAQGFSWRRSFERHLAVHRQVVAQHGVPQ